MTSLDLVPVTLAVGGLISFVEICFALTTDVARGYMLTTSTQSDRKEDA